MSLEGSARPVTSICWRGDFLHVATPVLGVKIKDSLGQDLVVLSSTSWVGRLVDWESGKALWRRIVGLNASCTCEIMVVSSCANV